MKHLFLTLFFIQIPVLGSYFETLVYKQIVGNEVVFHTYEITPRGSGYFIRLTRKSDFQNIDEEFDLDSLFLTRRWNYRNHTKQTDISAVRNENCIRLTGIYNGESIQKEFAIEPIPWAQLFPIGLEYFVQSQQEKMVFYAISSAPPSEMNIAKFSAEIVGREAISCNGDSVDAVHIRISLASWKSLFWRGDCWFRTSDARYIKWDAAGPPGQPRSVVELISE